MCGGKISTGSLRTVALVTGDLFSTIGQELKDLHLVQGFCRPRHLAQEASPRSVTNGQRTKKKRRYIQVVRSDKVKIHYLMSTTGGHLFSGEKASEEQSSRVFKPRNSYSGASNQGIRYLGLRRLFREAQRELETVLRSRAADMMCLIEEDTGMSMLARARSFLVKLFSLVISRRSL